MRSSKNHGSRIRKENMDRRSDQGDRQSMKNLRRGSHAGYADRPFSLLRFARLSLGACVGSQMAFLPAVGKSWKLNAGAASGFRLWRVAANQSAGVQGVPRMSYIRGGQGGTRIVLNSMDLYRPFCLVSDFVGLDRCLFRLVWRRAV